MKNHSLAQKRREFAPDWIISILNVTSIIWPKGYKAFQVILLSYFFFQYLAFLNVSLYSVFNGTTRFEFSRSTSSMPSHVSITSHNGNSSSKEN
jgi:hypothetical protein